MEKDNKIVEVETPAYIYDNMGLVEAQDAFHKHHEKDVVKWKKENPDTDLYIISCDTANYGKQFIVVKCPMSRDFETLMRAARGAEGMLDQSFNIILSRLLVYPDKAEFGDLYRGKNQYGVVNSIVNHLSDHLGYTGDSISKKL